MIQYRKHTLYETHHLLANIMDQGFLYHRAVTQLWAEIALNLTESVILPLDTRWYSQFLKEEFVAINSTYRQRLIDNGATLGIYIEQIEN